MAKVKVKAGQTLTDIAVQYLGSAEKVFALAQLNKLSVTADLTNGQELELTEVEDSRVVKFLENGSWQIAANLNLDTTLEGVGYWFIESDFIVS